MHHEYHKVQLFERARSIVIFKVNGAHLFRDGTALVGANVQMRCLLMLEVGDPEMRSPFTCNGTAV